MTYSLINKCAKNYYNRTFIVPVIAKKCSHMLFLRHSVLRRCHFLWSWVIGVLYRHKIHTYVIRWASHSQSVGPKVRFTVDSTWYVRRTSVYVYVYVGIRKRL